MLNFDRKRFHLACSAYKKYSIDMPFTWKNNINEPEIVVDGTLDLGVIAQEV